MVDFEEISKLLKIYNKELGIKKNIKNQLDEINVKFDKKPEIVPIVKFCLENYSLNEHKENMKIITRFENQMTKINFILEIKDN